MLDITVKNQYYSDTHEHERTNERVMHITRNSIVILQYVHVKTLTPSVGAYTHIRRKKNCNCFSIVFSLFTNKCYQMCYSGVLHGLFYAKYVFTLDFGEFTSHPPSIKSERSIFSRIVHISFCMKWQALGPWSNFNRSKPYVVHVSLQCPIWIYNVSHRNDSIASPLRFEIQKINSFTVFWGQCMDDDIVLDRMRPARLKHTKQKKTICSKKTFHSPNHLTHCAIEFGRIPRERETKKLISSSNSNYWVWWGEKFLVCAEIRLTSPNRFDCKRIVRRFQSEQKWLSEEAIMNNKRFQSI